MSENSVFFDMDDTLHEGDVFKEYIIFLARRSSGKVAFTWPILLPGLLGYLMFPDKRWSVSLILWCFTVMSSDRCLASIDSAFSTEFRARLKPHPEPFDALERHLVEGDRVYLVSGSPEPLLRLIYPGLLKRPGVMLIGSRFGRFMGGRVLCVRCVLAEKVRQITGRCGRVVQFKAGYSDSRKDGPVLELCDEKYRVNSAGAIERWPNGAF